MLRRIIAALLRTAHVPAQARLLRLRPHRHHRRGASAPRCSRSSATIDFLRVTLPFIDSIPKAIQVGRRRSTRRTGESGPAPARLQLHRGRRGARRDQQVRRPGARRLRALHRPAGGRAGREVQPPWWAARTARNAKDYNHRIEAINYTLSHDDGVTHRGLEEADIVLVGVSRSGKTPTCLYMAMQFGIKAANYPLIPEDLEANRLPPSLAAAQGQGLGPVDRSPSACTRSAASAAPIRRYAALENCRYEVAAAEKLMRQARHPVPRLDHQVDRGDRHRTCCTRRTWSAGVLRQGLARGSRLRAKIARQ